MKTLKLHELKDQLEEILDFVEKDEEQVEENIDKCFDNISGSAAAERRNHFPHLRDVGNVAVFCNVVGFVLRFRRNTFGVLGHWKNERYALYRFGRCLDGIYYVLYLCDSGIRRYLFRFPF